MPQLDKLTYSTQIFWLLVSFTSFYFIILKHILPNILLNIKTRENMINSMLTGNTSASTEVKDSNEQFVHLSDRLIANVRETLSNVRSDLQTSQKNVQEFQNLLIADDISNTLIDLEETKEAVRNI